MLIGEWNTESSRQHYPHGRGSEMAWISDAPVLHVKLNSVCSWPARIAMCTQKGLQDAHDNSHCTALCKQ